MCESHQTDISHSGHMHTENLTIIRTGLLYQHDLSRAFRQLPVDTYDYSMLGMHWQNLLDFDKVMSIGLHSAALACQMVTNAIMHAHHNMGYYSINYVDDFGSAELPEIAKQCFKALWRLLPNMGVKEAVKLQCLPSQEWPFLEISLIARNHEWTQGLGEIKFGAKETNWSPWSENTIHVKLYFHWCSYNCQP